MTTGLVIFAATYLLIAVQRLPFVHLNRPAASLLGAVAMVVFGVLPLVDAYAARAVCVANTLRCKIAHKKAFFAVLHNNPQLFSDAERQKSKPVRTEVWIPPT